jgi:hypothetical protein
MEFQELSQIWQNADDQLEQNIQLNQLYLKEISNRKIRSQMGNYFAEVIIELVVALFFQLFLGTFLGQHLDAPAFWIPAGVLMIANIYTIIFNVYQLHLYSQIRLDKPILETQRIMSRLRYLERLDTYSLLLLIPLLATPFLIVVAKYLLGLSLYTFSQYFLPFMAMNFIVAIIIVSLLRLFPDKGLKESQAFLKTIAEMER